MSTFFNRWRERTPYWGYRRKAPWLSQHSLQWQANGADYRMFKKSISNRQKCLIHNVQPEVGVHPP